MIKKIEFFFDSADGIHKLHAIKWIPEIEHPVSILQVVHGMAEYIDRYDDFATYMASRNILVVGDDHLGHGKSVGPMDTKGYFCDKDAPKVLVEDEHTLQKRMQEEYPGVPYFVLGHSMGSFITRNFLAQYGKEIQGAVICGTGMQSKMILTISTALSAFLTLFQGKEHVSKFMDHACFGNYNKEIENPGTPYDWLTHDAACVDAYMQDPDCGFVFTLNGFSTLFQLIRKLHDQTYVNRMPKELPIFIAAGREDPVGNYGKAVEGVYHAFRDMGMKDVSCRLYENMRHEIINETEKETVYEDLYRWIDHHIG